MLNIAEILSGLLTPSPRDESTYTRSVIAMGHGMLCGATDCF